MKWVPRLNWGSSTLTAGWPSQQLSEWCLSAVFDLDWKSQGLKQVRTTGKIIFFFPLRACQVTAIVWRGICVKSITRSLSAQFVFACLTLLLPWTLLSFNATAGIEVKCISSNRFALQQMAAFPQTSRNEEYLDFKHSWLSLSPGVC